MEDSKDNGMGKKQKAFDAAVQDITKTFISELSGKIANKKDNSEIKLVASFDEPSNLDEDEDVN